MNTSVPLVRAAVLAAVLFATTLAPVVVAQECQDALLTSQAEVDVFACSSVGRLIIGSAEGVSDITSLAPLSGLTEVRRLVVIQRNPLLMSLAGLETMTRIGTTPDDTGYIFIRDNEALETLDGLSGVTALGWFLRIEQNPALESLGGLENLAVVGTGTYGGQVEILDNDALTGLSGLEGLSMPGIGDKIVPIKIVGNDSLVEITALSGLSGRTHSVYVVDNPQLTSLQGLEGITSIFAVLDISNNDSLIDLTGLSGVTQVGTSVGRGLFITQNDALESIAGLSQIQQVADLSILDNASLSNLDGLSSLHIVSEGIDIQNNPRLTSIDALSSLTQAARVTISDNDALADLDGLSSLERIGAPDHVPDRSLVIRGNLALTDIDGLAALAHVSGDLRVEQNFALSSCGCGLYGLLFYGGVSGEIAVGPNAVGCMSVDDVIRAFPQNCRFPVDGDSAPEANARTLTVGPNPTVGAVGVRFALSTPGPARVTVYDVRGRLVATLLDGDAAGETSATLDVSDWAPGVYVARLDAPNRAESVTFTVRR